LFLSKVILLAIIIVIVFIKAPAYVKFIYAVIFLVIYQALFAHLGPDFDAYKTHYITLSETYHFEIGYESLVKLFRFFNVDFDCFYTIINLIGLSLYFNFFYKEIEDKNKSIFLIIPFICFIYFSLHINAIRQSIAVIIILYSLREMYSNRSKKILILIMLILTASLFHQSAIIAVIFPFIYYFSKKKHDCFIFVLILSIALYVTKIDLVGLLLSDYLSLLDSTMSSKLNFYNNTNNDNHFGVGFVDRIFLAIMIIFLKINFVRLGLFNKKIAFLYAISMSYLILQFLFFEYNNILQRLKYYFLPVIFLYWVSFVSKSKSNDNKTIIVILLFCYSIVNYFVRYLKS